jgi:hypothetical protein
MSRDPLATYTQDHLAGAAAAIELLAALRDQHAGEPLGAFVGRLLDEVRTDHGVLEGLAERVGGGPSVLKDTTAWIGAKVGRLKLGGGASGDLGTLEALETLSLGILGKRALWRALMTIAQSDPRLNGLDLERLAARAEAQHQAVEEQRLRVAGLALRASRE